MAGRPGIQFGAGCTGWCMDALASVLLCGVSRDARNQAFAILWFPWVRPAAGRMFQDGVGGLSALGSASSCQPLCGNRANTLGLADDLIKGFLWRFWGCVRAWPACAPWRVVQTEPLPVQKTWTSSQRGSLALATTTTINQRGWLNELSQAVAMSHTVSNSRRSVSYRTRPPRATRSKSVMMLRLSPQQVGQIALPKPPEQAYSCAVCRPPRDDKSGFASPARFHVLNVAS